MNKLMTQYNKERTKVLTSINLDSKPHGDLFVGTEVLVADWAVPKFTFIFELILDTNYVYLNMT